MFKTETVIHGEYVRGKINTNNIAEIKIKLAPHVNQPLKPFTENTLTYDVDHIDRMIDELREIKFKMQDIERGI